MLVFALRVLLPRDRGEVREVDLVLQPRLVAVAVYRQQIRSQYEKDGLPGLSRMLSLVLS